MQYQMITQKNFAAQYADGKQMFLEVEQVSGVEYRNHVYKVIETNGQLQVDL